MIKYKKNSKCVCNIITKKEFRSLIVAGKRKKVISLTRIIRELK